MPLPPFEDLETDLHKHNVKFTLAPSIWIDADGINNFFNGLHIENIKYFNNDCSAVNDKITQISNRKGGIYFFILKNKILPELSSHIMYVGRAQNTNAQNLRKRCREYYGYYKNESKRPHIHRMLTRWKNHLYLYYVELDDNDEIDSIEEQLINNILPPFNNNIPSAEIRRIKNATRAFP